MSRARHRRVQPYAWLGAGAVTLGMGVSMIGGAAVAVADTEAGGATPASDRAVASASPEAGRTASANPNRGRPAKRAARPDAETVATGSDGPGAAVSRAAARPRASLRQPESVAEAARPASPVPAAAAVEPESEAPIALPSEQALPAEREPEAGAGSVGGAPTATADTASRPAPVVTRRSARSIPVRAALADLAQEPAAVPAAASALADELPALAVAADAEWTSWLPGGANPGEQIVPGSYVSLAMQEIEATQAIIQQATWGSGNVFAGVASIVPQVFLASASLSLMAWGAANPAAQSLLAGTAGIPLIHQVAQVSLMGTMLLPTIAEASMGGAALFLPVVGLLGADVSAAEVQLASARQNGKVYAVVPVRVIYGTQPVIDVSVNGGRSATMLVDTGASGLVTTRDMVGAGDLGPKIGEGVSAFSGGLTYSYETYNAVVDFGAGAVTEPTPVNIVTDTEDYPDSVADFEDFLSWGADGILGVGANDLPGYAGGPGPAPIPNAVLPGELKDGFLLFQGLFFGLGGVMVFGPNPLPVRVAVPGAPDAYVQVIVNGTELAGPEEMIIDSGGVYGTLAAANDPTGTPVGSTLPAGTEISVYTPDGSTLLYTYRTGTGTTGTPVVAGTVMNSGNAPYAQGPIYLDYGFDDPYGIGSTEFSIW